MHQTSFANLKLWVSVHAVAEEADLMLSVEHEFFLLVQLSKNHMCDFECTYVFYLFILYFYYFLPFLGARNFLRRGIVVSLE